MITWNTVTSEELGELHLGVNWTRKSVYVNLADLVFMTYVSQETFMDYCNDFVINPYTEELYLDITEVIQALNQHNTLRNKKIVNWLERDIMPPIDEIMFEGVSQ